MNQIAVESTKIYFPPSKALYIIKGVKSFFNEIVVTAPHFDPVIMQNNPIMFVGTHRSHADYFILGSIAYEKGFKNLRYAAGKNLTDLPFFGHRFVSYGAFTVDRERSSNRSYVRDLCESVAGLLAQNNHVIVFPEGGRSYSGEMLPCKHGLIGTAIIAQEANPSKAVYYIPVSISYEHPPELDFFKILTYGKNLRKNASNPIARICGNILYFGADLLALVRFYYYRARKKLNGTVYVDFDRPYSVAELTDIAANIDNNTRDPFLAHRHSMQQVSEIIHRKFLSLYRLLPLHLVATVLDRSTINSRDQIISALPELVARLQKERRNMQSLSNSTPETLADQGIKQLIRETTITAKSGLVRVRDAAKCSYFAAACKPSGTEAQK
ncbi:MAG: 1-acyl-sn-glycerol-3-phosphate acyltransferase [Chitinivibrionales bacterium]|nr:1-acyl-sn-glycerol-3-phosphate acyltransferase [Chitinivibrionales bacterium]